VAIDPGDAVEGTGLAGLIAEYRHEAYGAAYSVARDASGVNALARAVAEAHNADPGGGGTTGATGQPVRQDRKGPRGIRVILGQRGRKEMTGRREQPGRRDLPDPLGRPEQQVLLDLRGQRGRRGTRGQRVRRGQMAIQERLGRREILGRPEHLGRQALPGRLDRTVIRGRRGQPDPTGPTARPEQQVLLVLRGLRGQPDRLDKMEHLGRRDQPVRMEMSVLAVALRSLRSRWVTRR
jgi:hypothetical protein